MDLLNMLVLDMIFFANNNNKDVWNIQSLLLKFKFWEFMHVGFLVMG